MYRVQPAMRHPLPHVHLRASNASSPRICTALVAAIPGMPVSSRNLLLDLDIAMHQRHGLTPHLHDPPLQFEISERFRVLDHTARYSLRASRCMQPILLARRWTTRATIWRPGAQPKRTQAERRQAGKGHSTAVLGQDQRVGRVGLRSPQRLGKTVGHLPVQHRNFDARRASSRASARSSE